MKSNYSQNNTYIPNSLLICTKKFIMWVFLFLLIDCQCSVLCPLAGTGSELSLKLWILRDLVGLLEWGDGLAHRKTLPTVEKHNTELRAHTSVPRAGLESAVPVVERTNITQLLSWLLRVHREMRTAYNNLREEECHLRVLVVDGRTVLTQTCNLKK